MIITPLEKWHLHTIDVQEAQKDSTHEWQNDAYFEAVSQSGAFAATKNGEVVCCFGALEMWEGRALMWCLLSKNAGRHMVAIHRSAQDFLNRLPYQRIEAYIKVGFDAGKRWVEMFGFKYEGTMKSFFPDGSSALLYARFK